MTQSGQAPRVVLHVGAMKTGTSTLQAILARHAATLAEQGVLYPCDPNWSVQVKAVRDVLDQRVRKQRPGRWAELVQQLRSHDGPLAVLSMEFLSFADLEHARRVVDSFPDAEVHAVLTLRDASRVLPSAWQEWTQNRGVASWAEYLATAEQLGPGGPAWGQTVNTPAGRAYSRVLDTDRMLSVWSAVVAPGRLHVVTVPAPDAPAGLLWERFATVLGLDAAAYDLPPRAVNESLDYHSADLMWRVNQAVSDLRFDAYDRVVKNRLCKETLAARAERVPVPLPYAARDVAARWAQHTVGLVESLDAAVVGDLHELEPVASRFSPDPVPATDRAAVVAAARVGLHGLGAEDDLPAGADVGAAVGAVANRLHQLASPERLTAAAAEAPPDSPGGGVRGLLRSWRGGRRPL